MPSRRPRNHPPRRSSSRARATLHYTGQTNDTAGASDTQPEAPACNPNDGLTTRERLTSQLYQSLLGNGIIALHHPPGSATSYFAIRGADNRPSYSVTLEAVPKLVEVVVTRWAKAGTQSLFDFNLLGEELEEALKELVDAIFHEWYDVFGKDAAFDWKVSMKASKLWV